ncbi:MAG: hypothetical protein KKD18_00680 [Nanoarchaeota archaeon]|nr:hypothetical protein [Nanoarchaeota archaeon]MBU0976912.1 hypothetical protein [Nanoarchaeota archaeon]
MGAETILVEYLGQPGWIAYSLFAFDVILSAFAVWRTTRLRQGVWAVLLLIFRTAGILPIVYLVFFAKWKKKNHTSDKAP